MSQEKQEKPENVTSTENPKGASFRPEGKEPIPDLSAQDVFSSKVIPNSVEDEMFIGDLSFLKDLTRRPESTSSRGFLSGPVARSIYMILGGNILLMLVVIGVIWYQPTKVVNFRVSDSSSAAKNRQTQKSGTDASESQTKMDNASEYYSEGLAEAMEKVALTPEDKELFKRGVSLKTADALFLAGRYLEACYVYNQISQNWISSVTTGDYMKDYLKLRMAVCMNRAGEEQAQGECFTHALQSRAPYVRGLANYYLARIHYQNQNYLEARQNAYQAIALCRAFEDMVPSSFEVDMYFLAVDSLTREVVGFYNFERELPGRDWSDVLMDIWPTETDTLRLEEALCRSAQRLAEGGIGPILSVDANRPVSTQWSLICLQSPLEETLWKIVSAANLKAVWKDDSQDFKSHPVSAYMAYVPQQYIAETICGSLGLIWQFDGQDVSILNPSGYNDFDMHRNRLIQETISMWQRFLLRYRDDRRIPNAHYALGRMYLFGDQTAAALGEFKLLQGRFSQNALAPYAYLEAGKIKVDMKDYKGAGTDLNEMLLLYPNCPVVNQATLYLAQTTFESGQIEQAKELFRKSYQMNLSKSGNCEVMIGLGRCAYFQENWKEAETSLSKALELVEDKNDARIGPICMMLGKAYIEGGRYADAAHVLRIAMNSRLSEKEYLQTILELVDAECRQQNYLEAMNILDQVPQGHLGQEGFYNLLIARARILREIGVVESAISLLRKKIEYIADSSMRARLTLELAECYMITEDYSVARRELNSVLPDMPDAYHARRANLLLAQIIEKVGQPSRAEGLCLAVLSDPQAEENIRTEAFNTLGRIYTHQNAYEKAAMAFAGVLPQGVDK